MSLRTVISFIIVLALLVGIWYYLRPGDRPEPPVDTPVPVLSQIPKAYWAQADGTITIEAETANEGLTSIESVEATGRVRLRYLVYPDSRVVISAFNVWMGDANLEVRFLFWDVQQERLRCTVFYSDRNINGNLANNRIVIPAGTPVLGHTYDRRGTNGSCGGAVRMLDAEAPDQIRVVHEPALGRFGVNAAFTVDYEGNEVTVTLDASGNFINRPPVANFELSGPGVETADDGCPIPVANTPEGLEMSLSSTSYDLDGNFPEELDIKQSRADIAFEQWARSTPEGFRYLGEGPDGGTELFKSSEDHQLILWVTDRQAAEARKLCRFRVKEPE